MQLVAGTPEAIFAQKLASGDPKTRKKALNKLRTWIGRRMKSETYFTLEDMLKLWKGLYFCMWMQDKPLLQEELSESVSGLVSCFSNTEQKLMYLKTFLDTVAREWYGIDRWRMDKFLMLVRRFLREWLSWLKESKWDEKLVKRTMDIWKNSVFSEESTSCPSGLKFHFASIYLDEIDNAGKDDLDWTQVNRFLKPYIDLVTSKIGDDFFDTILNEIFETILLQYSSENLDEGSEENSNPPGIKFDYESIASDLFDAAKCSYVTGDRRKKLYEYIKKFRIASQGLDPFEENVSDVGSDIDEQEIDKAAHRYIRRKQVGSKEKKKQRKMAKKRPLASPDVSGNDDSNNEEEKSLASSKGNMKQKNKKRFKKTKLKIV